MLTVAELARRINKLIDDGFADAKIYAYVGDDGIQIQAEADQMSIPSHPSGSCVIISCPSAVPTAGGLAI